MLPNTLLCRRVDSINLSNGAKRSMNDVIHVNHECMDRKKSIFQKVSK